jgi:hypothetical protein
LNISLEATAVANANWNIPITSSRLNNRLLRTTLYRKMPLELRKVVRKYLLNIDKYDCNSIMQNCFHDQLINCKQIQKYLSVELSMLGNYDQVAIENLFTVTSFIEELECGQSTLNKYYDVPFI